MLDIKRFLKNDFKNFKRLGLPVSTTQVAQDATQVTQDVFYNFKKCLKNEQKVKVNPLLFFLDIKRFLKNDFKNFKHLGLPVSTTQVAQDATQVTQDVFYIFKKCFKNEQKVKVNPLPFCLI